MRDLILHAPMYINWNYTYKCNFNCDHCYSRSRSDIGELDTEQKLTIAKNIAKNKVFIVNLGGGEPLLSNDCFQIIQYLSSQNVSVNLSTNGWETSTETIYRLKEAGLKGVFVSIDHSDAALHDQGRNQPGSFQEACKAISNYAAAGLKVNLSTTITSVNFPVLEKIIALGNSLGASGIDLKRLKISGNASGKNHLELSEAQEQSLYNSIPRWKETYPLNINLVYNPTPIGSIDAGCPCGKTALSIMSNGDITPCVYNTYVIGNALVDDIHDIWVSSAFLNYFRRKFHCMGLTETITKKYRVKQTIMMQKDARIDDSMEIYSFVRETDEPIDPNDTIAVISDDGNLYELNMTGAIIFEGLLLHQDVFSVADKISTLFGLSTEDAIETTLAYIRELTDLDLVTPEEHIL